MRSNTGATSATSIAINGGSTITRPSVNVRSKARKELNVGSFKSVRSSGVLSAVNTSIASFIDPDEPVELISDATLNEPEAPVAQMAALNISDEVVHVESEDTGDSDADSKDRATERARCPPISTEFIEIRHHPSTGLEMEYIFRDLPAGIPSAMDTLNGLPLGLPVNSDKPWAPFRNRADFEFAQLAVKEGLHSTTIKELLNGIKNRWTNIGQSRLTFKGKADFNDSFAFARNYIVLCN
ncbi:hypothetical protein K439DRAFT_1617303 [Ramaria rubella]|nr:hypothetical protein K439DRAFT_1617303 [Ramaria rubella]